MIGSQTESISTEIVNNLIQKVNLHIETKKALEKLPSQLQSEIHTQIDDAVGIFQIRFKQCQEKYGDENKIVVPKIKRENFMPKFVIQEVQEIKKFDTKRSNTINSRMVKRKSSKIDNFSKSFQSQKQSIIQEEEMRIQPLDINIENQERQSEQVSKLRNLKEKSLFDQENIKKDLKQRQVRNEEKKKQFQKSFHGKPFTYDYDCNSMKSNINKDKIKLITTRGSWKQPYLKKQSENLSKTSEFRKIEFTNKLNNSKQSNYEGSIKAMVLPLFPLAYEEEEQKRAATMNMKRIKMKEYKNTYGNKFSRIIESYQTLDVNCNQLNVQKQPQSKVVEQIVESKILNETIYLKDSTVSKKSNQKFLHSRKMALPRLNGNYKVLDRYE